MALLIATTPESVTCATIRVVAAGTAVVSGRCVARRQERHEPDGAME
jgi:hypothetical protein